jgi:hypothetical protein
VIIATPKNFYEVEKRWLLLLRTSCSGIQPSANIFCLSVQNNEIDEVGQPQNRKCKTKIKHKTVSINYKDSFSSSALFFKISVFNQINAAARSNVEIIHNMKAKVCQGESKLKLGL